MCYCVTLTINGYPIYFLTSYVHCSAQILYCIITMVSGATHIWGGPTHVPWERDWTKLPEREVCRLCLRCWELAGQSVPKYFPDGKTCPEQLAKVVKQVVGTQNNLIDIPLHFQVPGNVNKGRLLSEQDKSPRYYSGLGRYDVQLYGAVKWRHPGSHHIRLRSLFAQEQKRYSSM